MNVQKADVLTWPNLMSATGFAMAVHGSTRLNTTSGLVETVAGRLLDVADGFVARRTGQASEFGATVDATLDKFAGLAILVAEGQKGIAPLSDLGAMFGQNITNSVATAVAIKRHPELDLAPTKDGKHAMASQNLALGAYAFGNLIKDHYPRAAQVSRTVGRAATIAGVYYFGSKATNDYVNRAR
jgi:phosphatidylglycerophosphate synthase